METVTLELPSSLFTDLQALAAEQDGDLVAMLSLWVRQRQNWLRELCELRRSTDSSPHWYGFSEIHTQSNLAIIALCLGAEHFFCTSLIDLESNM